MSRVYIPSQTFSPIIYPDSGNYRPKNGASVQIKNVDGTNATHWSSQTGGTSSTGALTAGSDGTLPGRWIETGAYSLVIDGGAALSVEAVSGGDIAGLKATRVIAGQAYPPYAQVDTTGAADSAGALQSLIDNVLPARGGDIVWPLGAKVKVASTVTISKPNVRFVGNGGAFGGTEAAAQTWLEYTGTTRGVDARSSYGFTIENMYVTGYSLGAAGILIDFDRTSNDTTSMVIRDTWLRATNNSNGTLVTLQNAQSGVFAHNIYMGGARAFRGTVTGGGADFSNSMTLSGRSIFQYQASAPILNPNQAWTIQDQVFQQIQTVTGPAGAVECQSTHVCEQFTYIGNSHQDATGGGDWLTLRGNGFHIAGNFWNTGAKAIVFVGACDGVSITGNTFWGLSTAAIDGGSTGVTNFEEDGNRYTGNGTDIIGKINVDLGGALINSDGHTTASSGSTWPAANRALFVRYVPRKTYTFTGVAFHCTTADAGSPNGDVAVLSSSRARLASSGSVSAVATTGVRYLAFTAPVVLRKGIVYYVGLGLVSTTAAVAFMAQFSSGTTAELISNATPTLLQGYVDSSVPIGSTPGAFTSNASIPLLALRTT